MKIICTGDWHLTGTPPTTRRDQYAESQKDKINQILEMSRGLQSLTSRSTVNYNGLIIQPGDFFDKPREPYWVVYQYGSMLESIPFLSLPGQHDLHYHVDNLKNTPLGLMTKICRRMQLIPNHKLVLEYDGTKPYTDERDVRMLRPKVCVYGASWGHEVPEVQDPEAFNILVTHQMIVDEKLWYDQQEFSYGNIFLRKHPGYDLVVSGDNHHFFVCKTDGEKKRYLVNCGSLMRSKSDQKDHEPAVVIVDTDERSLEVVKLKVLPYEQVFDEERIVREKQRDANLDAFVEKVKGGGEVKDTDFLANLREYVSKNKVDPEVVEEISLILGKGEDAISNSGTAANEGQPRQG